MSVFSVLFTPSSKEFNHATFMISDESSLSIIGFTNINTFTCNYNIYKIDPKQEVNYKRQGSKILFTDTDLKLKSTAFDCGSKMMNRDFNKLLETEVYPNVSLKLIEIISKDIYDNQVNTLIEVTICGKSNKYSIPVTISESGKLSVKGRLEMDIHDFGLKPPKKALGLIKVDDTIIIDFNLFFKKL